MTEPLLAWIQKLAVQQKLFTKATTLTPIFGLSLVMFTSKTQTHFNSIGQI